MDTLGAVELDYSLWISSIFRDGSADCENISIGVPFTRLNEHSCVNEVWFGVTQFSHELHSTALISDTETGGVL